MTAKSYQERLFGAACVYVTLERSGLTPEKNELYLATLSDLQIEPEAVEGFLVEQRARVEGALQRREPVKE